MRARAAHFARASGVIRPMLSVRASPPVATPADASPSLPGPTLLRRSSQPWILGLSDFEVGKPLGRGSFGSVQKVVRKDTGEVFALKTMSRAHILDLNLGENVQREVSTQQKSRHPNVLRLYEYFEDQQGIYLLLEYAPHGSLLQLLKDHRKAAAASDQERRGLPETHSAGVFRDVAGALHFLHCNCVVHRDLKPENVLMCAGGVAKLADFGWSSQLARGADRRTFCGTPEYLSPEMIASEPYGLAVDVWALGVLLFEVLAGRSPFAAGNYGQVLIRISTAAYEFPGHVSAPARDLVGALLVREPGRRLCPGRAAEHPWVREHASPDEEAHATPSAVDAGDAAPDIQAIYEATARTIQAAYGAKASRTGRSGARAEVAPRPELHADLSDCSAPAQLLAPSVWTPARGSGSSGAWGQSEGTWSASSFDGSYSLPSLAGSAATEGLATRETQCCLAATVAGARTDDVPGKGRPEVATCSARTSPLGPAEQHGGTAAASWAGDLPRDRSALSPPSSITTASGGTSTLGACEESLVQVAEDDFYGPWSSRQVCEVRSAPARAVSLRSLAAESLAGATLRSRIGSGIRERMAVRQRSFAGIASGAGVLGEDNGQRSSAPVAEPPRGDAALARRRRATCPSGAATLGPVVHNAGAAWAAWARAK